MNTLAFSESISRFTVAFFPVLLGIVLHEVAHGWAAWKCGDPTARMLGRLTVNPLPHIDPMGTIVFVLTALFSPFVFGWAKPVPVNPRYFRHARRDSFFVSIAGPLSNMLLALLFAMCLRLLLFLPPETLSGTVAGKYAIQTLQIGIIANFCLAWINLLPLPPLDGGHIVEALLPYPLSHQFAQLSKYGFIILILLLASDALNLVLSPLIRWSSQAALWLFGL